MSVSERNMPVRPRVGATFAIVCLGLFMVVLDNLVVTVALPSIRKDLGTGIGGLEWTVNAYTLAYAVLLLPAAALGDRFGRKRVFTLGLAIFTLSSCAAALAPSIGALVAARVVQGIGGAVVTPLSLTLLAEAMPEAKRGLALGAWSGIAGLGVAFGPVVGGAVINGLSWQWIFWINVPVGIATVITARRWLNESFGPARRLDLLGLALAAAGLFGIVFGVVRGNSHGWGTTSVWLSIALGVVVLGCFLAWERGARDPMVPLRFFGLRAFSATNGVSFAMYFGVFGSSFLLAQYFQTAWGYSPLQAGLRLLPWTLMPMFVSPLAGAASDRIGSRPLMATGLALQGCGLGWIAALSTPDKAYGRFVPAMVLAGIGMGLVFAPTANVLLKSVAQKEAGRASGIHNAIRELGGVFGVAALACVFIHNGGYQSPQAFVNGVEPAVWVGAAVCIVGAAIALLVPGRRRASATIDSLAATGEAGAIAAAEAVPAAAAASVSAAPASGTVTAASGTVTSETSITS